MGKIGDVAMGLCPRCGKENGTIVMAKKNYKGQMNRYEVTPDLCDTCLEAIKTAATLVCNNCGQIVAKIEAGTTPDGFVIEPNSTLHTDACSKCSSKSRVEILEMKGLVPGV